MPPPGTITGSGSVAGGLDQLPDARRRQRQIAGLDAEIGQRVGDRVGDHTADRDYDDSLLNSAYEGLDGPAWGGAVGVGRGSPHHETQQATAARAFFSKTTTIACIAAPDPPEPNQTGEQRELFLDK